MESTLVDYPNKSQELEILKKNSFGKTDPIQPVINCQELADMGELIEKIYVDDKLKAYIVDLIFATRQPDKYGMDMGEYIEFGASPRASIFLAKAARVNAFLSGRSYITPQDIKIVGPDVLRHRIILSFEAEAEDIATDSIIQTLFDSVEVP